MLPLALGESNSHMSLCCVAATTKDSQPQIRVPQLRQNKHKAGKDALEEGMLQIKYIKQEKDPEESSCFITWQISGPIKKKIGKKNKTVEGREA